MIGGIKQFAVINPETDEVVVLKNISAESTYDPQIIETEDTTGAMEGGKETNLEIIFYDADSAKISLLNTWMTQNTPVQCSGWGYQGAVMWHEAVTIHNTSELNPNARDGLQASTLRFYSVNPFQDIKVGRNLFKTAAWQPTEGRQSGGEYEAKRAIESSVFDSLGTTFDSSATYSGIEFLFPFEGVPITFAVTPEAGRQATPRIIAKSSTATLETETGAQSNAGERTAPISITTPANTYKIELLVALDAAGEANQATARLDNKSDFINE